MKITKYTPSKLINIIKLSYKLNLTSISSEKDNNNNNKDSNNSNN